MWVSPQMYMYMKKGLDFIMSNTTVAVARLSDLRFVNSRWIY